MSAKLKFTRNPYGLTTLELRSKDFDLELKLVSRLGKRERRTIIRGFLRHIKPWLIHLRDGAIDQGLLFDNPRAKLGYEIRMKRLRMGLTQKELATRLNISRSHLSDMERGHFTPRAKTWSAVSQFLQEATPGFDD